MFKLIRQSVLSTLCLAVLLCAAYPMLVTGAADASSLKKRRVR